MKTVAQMAQRKQQHESIQVSGIVSKLIFKCISVLLSLLNIESWSKKVKC